MNLPVFGQARKQRVMGWGLKVVTPHSCTTAKSIAATVVDIENAKSLQHVARFSPKWARPCLSKLESKKPSGRGLKHVRLHRWTTAETNCCICFDIKTTKSLLDLWQVTVTPFGKKSKYACSHEFIGVGFNSRGQQSHPMKIPLYYELKFQLALFDCNANAHKFS